jgi:uncharacterized protein
MAQTTETNLTDSEKLIILLLAEVLKSQEGYGDKKRMELLQDIIHDGHLWALKQERFIPQAHVDSKISVDLVYSTLDMWSIIEEAYNGFTAEETQLVKDGLGEFGIKPKFQGFDGNHETEYLSITRFIVDKLERYQIFKGRDFNSHSPMISRP